MDISQAQHSLNYYGYQAQKDLPVEEYSGSSSEGDCASPMWISPSPSRPPSHVSKNFRRLAFSGSQQLSNCNLFSDNEQDVARKPRSRRRVSTSATTRAKSRSPMRPHSLESEQHMSTPVSSKVRSYSPRRPHLVEFGWHTQVTSRDRSRSPRRPHSVEFGQRTQVTRRDRSHSPRRPHSVEFERRMCTQMTTRDRSRSPRRSRLVESAFSAPVAARDESRSPRRPQSAGPLFEILSEVKKTNSRLENFEKRLQQLEESMQTPVSSRLLTKRTVPTRVRHLVRDMYKTLIEDDENFPGFDLKKRYMDAVNQQVVQTLIRETKGQDPTISTTQIQAAARRFFQSRCEESALKAKGTYNNKVKAQRRRNRLVKRLHARKATLEGVSSTANAAKVEKWQTVWVLSFMSSKESGEDESEQPIIYVKPLPWRHPQVNKFFMQMDDRIEKKKSKRVKIQTLPRVQGEVSRRPRPTEFPHNFWGFIVSKT